MRGRTPGALERRERHARLALVQQDERLARQLLKPHLARRGKRVALRQHGEHRVRRDGAARQAGSVAVYEAKVHAVLADPLRDARVLALAQHEAHVRVQLLEAVHKRRQYAAAHARERAHADRGAQKPRHLLAATLKVVLRVRHRADGRHERAPVAGEAHGAAAALKQARPQLRLQRAHGLAHGALRVAQLARRLREAAGVDDAAEHLVARNPHDVPSQPST
jgi:hypothetical protein